MPVFKKALGKIMASIFLNGEPNWRKIREIIIKLLAKIDCIWRPLLKIKLGF